MRGQPGHTRPRNWLPPSFLSIKSWMIPQLNLASIHKQRGSFICLSYFLDMLSMRVVTTRYCQTSGRLVQELDICTVVVYRDGRRVCAPPSPIQLFLHHPAILTTDTSKSVWGNLLFIHLHTQWRHIHRPRNRLPPSFLGINAWMTS